MGHRYYDPAGGRFADCPEEEILKAVADFLLPFIPAESLAFGRTRKDGRLGDAVVDLRLDRLIACE